MQILCATVKCCRRSRDLPEKVIMTSDNIAEYVGENNQFTEKPVTEYPPVIQDNTVTTKDYLYSNNIDTDLLVVIGGLIVILFLMMLIMYFINSLRHKELTEILEKISFLKNPGAICLNRRRSAVICCPCVCWHRYSVHPESWQKSPGDHRGECAGNCMDAGEQSY